MRVFALAADGRRWQLEIENAWPHKQYLVVKFRGIDTLSGATEIVGLEFQVPAAERAPLDPGATYISDLIGCRIWDGERQIGAIREVRFGAGEAPLLVVGWGKGELEIPYAQEFLIGIDLDQKRIDMRLPDGLLEVNAPITEQEKKLLSGEKH
jgi:16S rRNA processing protein RimM